MKEQTITDNSIFIQLLIGSLLFIAATGFTIVNISNIAMLKLSHTMPAIVLSLTAMAFLYKAIKSDKARAAAL